MSASNEKSPTSAFNSININTRLRHRQPSSWIPETFKSPQTAPSHNPTPSPKPAKPAKPGFFKKSL